jgi:hypothetical protein
VRGERAQERDDGLGFVVRERAERAVGAGHRPALAHRAAPADVVRRKDPFRQAGPPKPLPWIDEKQGLPTRASWWQKGEVGAA